jgi:hypothetical protein
MNKKTAPLPPETKSETLQISQLVWVNRDPEFDFRLSQQQVAELKETTNFWLASLSLPACRVVVYLVFDPEVETLTLKPPKKLTQYTEWYWWMPSRNFGSPPLEHFCELWVEALRLSSGSQNPVSNQLIQKLEPLKNL